MTKDNQRGIAMMLLAVALLSVMDAGLKALAGYPPLQVAALRAAASWPIVAAYLVARGGLRPLLRVRWPLHLFRGVLGVAMLSAFTWSLRELPLTTAYTLFFVAPLIIALLSGPLLGERIGAHRWIAIVGGFAGVVVALLSGPLLGERIGAHRWIAIVGGFAGVVVALQPGAGGAFTWASLAVLLAALGYAVSAITVRVLGRTDSTASMVFWMLTLISLGAGALALPGWVALRPQDWLVVAGIGVVGAIGQFAITEAFARGEASVVAPFEYTALVWGVAFDALVWRALPGTPTWIGAAIIVACGLYLIRQERGQEPARVAAAEPSVQP